MISDAQLQNELHLIISNAIREDVGAGDFSSLACIPDSARGKAKLLVKDEGIIAGVAFAKMIFEYVDVDLKIETFINDGATVKPGDEVFHVSGSSQSILKAERLVLNSMQRMSAIATKTQSYVKLLEGTSTKILDTRKTTPGFRACEKWAVKIGGGEKGRHARHRGRRGRGWERFFSEKKGPAGAGGGGKVQGAGGGGRRRGGGKGAKEEARGAVEKGPPADASAGVRVFNTIFVRAQNKGSQGHWQSL